MKNILELDLSFESFLGNGDLLSKLEDLLRSWAPDWSEDLHLWRFREEKRRVHGNLREVLYDAVGAAATDEGWRLGSAEFRGANKGIILVCLANSRGFQPLGPQVVWGNSVSIQLLQKKVGGTPVGEWAKGFFAEACAQIAPPYGYVASRDEYAEKNLDREGGGVEAVGLDLARAALPGLYWLNFFGRKLHGRFRTRSGALDEAAFKRWGDGLMVQIGVGSGVGPAQTLLGLKIRALEGENQPLEHP